MMRFLAIPVFLLLTANAATAGERIVRLSVPGMFCEACPYIVAEAIGAVDGVSVVEATIEDKTATVTYDDVVSDVAAILAAASEIGYDASVIDPAGTP